MALTNPSVVALGVPAKPEFGRVVRVGAAHLAGRNGFSLSAIADLRLAIDEAMILLIGARSKKGRIEIEYRIWQGRLEIDFVSAINDAPALTDEALSRFQELGASVVDEATVDESARAVTLVKSTS